MFKSTTLLALLMGVIILSHAQDKKMEGNKMIRRGFFLNVGVALPSQTFSAAEISNQSGTATPNKYPSSSTSATQSLGVQPSIELGNQWYFWKNEKMGIGLRVSWFQLGYSSYALNSSSNFGFFRVGLVDLRLLKLAPQFTYALNDKIAFDFSFEISPTLFLGGGANTINGNTVGYGTSTIGLLFAPGVKFRYNIFAVGFDLGFASPSSSQVIVSGSGSSSNTYTEIGKAATLYPRLYLGFKF